MGVDIIGAVLKQLDAYLALIFGSFMASFGGFMKAFVVLYLLLMGIAFIKSTFAEHTKEIGLSIILVIVLQEFIKDYSVYQYWVVAPVRDTALHMASFFVNAGTGGGGDGGLEGIFFKLDESFLKMADTVQFLFPKANPLWHPFDFVSAIMSLGAMTLAFGLVYIAYMILVCMGFFSMYVLFIVGGPCIFFGAFKTTRFVTWSWCRALANYTLLVVFASLVMGICINGISTSMDSLAANSDPSMGYFTREIAYVICWSLLSFGLLLKSADYASALSGGMAGSTAMITGGLAIVGGGLFAASKMATNNSFTRGAAKGLGQGLSVIGNRAYSNMKGINRGGGPLDTGGK